MKKPSSIPTKSLIPLGSLILLTSLIASVEAAPQFEILSHTGYIDSSGYYNVVGEVQNTGDQAARYVEISTTFYDSTDAVVGESFAASYVEFLLAGRKSPFRILLVDTSKSLKVDHYSLSAYVLSLDPPPPPSTEGLEILSHSSYIDALDLMHIVGEVKNIGNEEATNVEVIATCYDETGSVVEAGWVYTNPIDIETGQTAPFDVLIMGDNSELVDSYALTTESTEYAEIPESNSHLLLLLSVSVSLCIIFYKLKPSKT